MSISEGLEKAWRVSLCEEKRLTNDVLVLDSTFFVHPARFHDRERSQHVQGFARFLVHKYLTSGSYRFHKKFRKIS